MIGEFLKYVLSKRGQTITLKTGSIPSQTRSGEQFQEVRRSVGRRLSKVRSTGWKQMAERALTDKVFNVLFLCTGNSARSILAECLLNRLGQGRFKAYSAGSKPKGQVHPYALELLAKLNFVTDSLRSKGWDEFAAPGAPALDFVFTLCDEAAAEECPVWPGQPMTAHWGLPDPAAAFGDEVQKRIAFWDTFRMLNNRISIFVSLPMKSLDKLSLQKRLDEIGRTEKLAQSDQELLMNQRS